MASGRKIFVGSLPDGVQELTLREEFSKYGLVEDIFVKVPCEPGRQWAMVTFSRPEDAQTAKDATDRTLKLPGGDRPAEVMFAKGNEQNQAGAVARDNLLPKKIHVGSLPDEITEAILRAEFGKFGEITDMFLKTGLERNKQWAIITFANGEDAQEAKVRCDRILHICNSSSPVEVTIARNQGRAPQAIVTDGPSKIFVGSMPDDITEAVVREKFSEYGEVLDVFLKTRCESHKQWAFVVFANNAQATRAKECTDRILRMPNSTKPCEVMFAKNQGKNGSDQSGSSGSASAAQTMVPGMPAGVPAQYAWRVYMTPQGIPYYHNHSTGATQWECPPDFQMSQVAQQAATAQTMYGAMLASMAPPVSYRPY